MENVENSALEKSKVFKQYVLVMCVCIGGLCGGTAMAWTSPALPELIEQDIITQNEEGIIGSLLPLGALIASIPSGYLADMIGRKKTLFFLAIPFVISWTLIITANNSVMLYISRFLAGISAASMCVCIPMYIGETAEASIRGALAAFLPTFINVGALSTGIFSLFLTWKWFSVALGCISVICVLLMLALPETPTYLLKIGNADEARKVLKILRGEKYANLETELKDTEIAVKEANEHNYSLKELLSSRANRRALIIGVGVMAFQQLNGINAIVFYAESIFKLAGSGISPDVASIVVYASQVIFATIPVFIVEKANRKFFMRISGIGAAICLAMLGIYFHLKTYDINPEGLNILPLISLILFILFFSIGFGSVPWMIIGEVFAQEIKGFGMGLALVACWLATFLVTFVFPLVNNNLGGHVSFYIFAGTSILGTLFVEFFVPETRGKSFLEIQEILNQ